jgi:cytidylate kinase
VEKSLAEENTLTEIDKGSMVTITISGTPGSGKTTVGTLLAKRLGLRYIYSGLLFSLLTCVLVIRDTMKRSKKE